MSFMFLTLFWFLCTDHLETLKTLIKSVKTVRESYNS